MIAAEFEVIANNVEPRFWPDKQMMHGEELDSSTEVGQQVIHAGKVRAGEEVAGKSVLVKADAL